MEPERAAPLPIGDSRQPAGFRAAGYTMVRGLVEPALADTLWWYALERADAAGLKGDKLVREGQIAYGNTVMERVLEWLQPVMRRVTGLDLDPTYSYFRVYPTGSVLRPHTDRPACEVSVTLNVGQVPDAPWAFGIRGPAGESIVELAPGDAVVYRGCDCTHWRGAFEGERLAQVLLHYVDRAGPLAHWVHDGRGSLYVKPVGYYAPLARRLALARVRRGARDDSDAGPFGEYSSSGSPGAVASAVDWRARERRLIRDAVAEDPRRWFHKGGAPTPASRHARSTRVAGSGNR